MDPIKNIMIATDFSANANHALTYGIKLAEKLSADVTVFYGYNLADTTKVPASTVGMGYVYDGPNPEKMETWAREEFDKVWETYLKQSTVKASFVPRLGVIEDNLEWAIKENNADLLVMGAKGGQGLDILLGSTTTDMIYKTPCPLLVVPEKVDLEPVRKIAFAFDNQEIEEVTHLESLKKIASPLGASVEVLTVKSAEEEISYGPNLEQALKPVKRNYHSVVNKDVEKGINNFVKNNEIDWLAMIPIKHNLFERIFKRDIVKKMAFHSEIPLFVF